MLRCVLAWRVLKLRLWFYEHMQVRGGSDKLVVCCLLFSSVWDGDLLKMSAINATAGFIKNK